MEQPPLKNTKVTFPELQNLQLSCLDPICFCVLKILNFIIFLILNYVFIFLDCFDIMVYQKKFKKILKKYYFNIFSNKKYFKK